MLTQEYKLTPLTDSVFMTPFLAKTLNRMADEAPGLLMHWQPVDTERFQLVLNETERKGQPVNRNDADYWISQFARLGAMGEGERVERVKVAEVAR